jgi:SAM-dependent methyltransferase
MQRPGAKVASMTAIGSEAELARVARALAGEEAAYSPPEGKLATGAKPVDPDLVQSVRALIEAGSDPLGEAFCLLRPGIERRASGAIYTPAPIISSMVRWAAEQGVPARVVDPGCGSGRFLLAAARRFPKATLVAVDTDPLAILMLRANVAVLGLTGRLVAWCADYRRLTLPAIDGPTLFIGNPPYVRHHDIGAEWKTWFAETAAIHGFKASKLAGLHIHFFLKTRQLGRVGDRGAFITSAEWLDVNYGAVLRKMLADGLGGTALHVLTPESMPFADAATTGAITCFHVGKRPGEMVMRSVDSLGRLENLAGGTPVPWPALEKANRWTTILKPTAAPPDGYIELGEICRVHRGQVTGGNDTWIAGAYPGELPEAFLFPAVTKARELLAAGAVLASADRLRRVIDLPPELDTLDAWDRERVERFLEWAKARGAHQSYIASARRAWWSVNLRAPAPVLCTYMARRPPAFVRNLCGARHVNIAHGLYPRERLSDADLMALIVFLSKQVRTESGRTYAGGLTKFEPKEVERIPIPRLERLHDIAAQMDDTAIARRHRGSEDHLPA